MTHWQAGQPRIPAATLSAIELAIRRARRLTWAKSASSWKARSTARRTAMGSEWGAICRDMEAAFRTARYEQGAVQGIHAVTRQLTKHYPARIRSRNELPDEAMVL